MRQQARSEETRTRIFNAARTCFSRTGYEATSVDDICKEAGATKGAFYYHFESKHALFLELLNKWLAQFDQHFFETRDETQNVADGLIEMAGSTRIIFTDSSNYLPMFLEFWLHSIRDPIIWNKVIEPYRRYMELFTRLFDSGNTDGSFQAADPRLASRTLIAIAIGMILQGLMDPHGADWGGQTQESVRLLLKGLRPEG